MSDVALERPSLTMTEIFSQTADLLRRNALRGLVAVSALTAAGLLADLNQAGAEFPILQSFLTIGLQYWLTRALLDDLGATSTSPGGIGSFFVLGIVTGLGIGIGFVLLVIPGIILWVRWSISGAAVVADGEGYSAAISYSWDATRRHFWPILGTLLAIWTAGVLGAGVGLYLQAQDFSIAGAIVSELSLSALMVIICHATLGIFVLLRPNFRLSQVFA